MVELSVRNKYKVTASAGEFTQTFEGEFSGFVASGGEVALRFIVKPWIFHQEIPAKSVVSIEDLGRS
jgi:hypothetical protein